MLRLQEYTGEYKSIVVYNVIKDKYKIKILWYIGNITSFMCRKLYKWRTKNLWIIIPKLPHYSITSHLHIWVFSTDICWEVEEGSCSSSMGVGALTLSLAAILFLIRADSDFLGGFSGRTWQCTVIVIAMTENYLTLSTLISCSARDMPCFTSIQRSVSSLRTSLVTRGVAGTTSYCWEQRSSLLTKNISNLQLSTYSL